MYVYVYMYYFSFFFGSIPEITNMFFIALFTMEMMLKMYSLGFQVSFPLPLERFKK